MKFIVDLFRFNNHEFSLVGINYHTHLGAKVIESRKFLVQVLMAYSKKNNIMSVEEKSKDNISKLVPLASCDFQTLLYLTDVNTKNARGKGTPLLNPYISFNIFRPPFVGINLGTTIPYR